MSGTPDDIRYPCRPTHVLLTHSKRFQSPLTKDHAARFGLYFKDLYMLVTSVSSNVNSKAYKGTSLIETASP